MKRFCSRIFCPLARETGGAEIAEFAAILPLLFMVLMGIYWFGQAFRIYGTATSAARAGARAAVAPSCTTCTATTPAQNAQTAVQNALQNASLSTNQLVPTSNWNPPNLCTCSLTASTSSCAAPVTCDTGLSINICVQENVQLSYSSKGGMGTCGTSVSMRYQYPYHFGLPGTNLDLGNLQLPGQAEMRAETQ